MSKSKLLLEKTDESKMVIQQKLNGFINFSNFDLFAADIQPPDNGIVTAFTSLAFLVRDEEADIKDVKFNDDEIIFKTDRSEQYLHVSTKILTDPLLSQILLFGGIAFSRADVVDSVFVTDQSGNTEKFSSSSGLALNVKKTIDKVKRIDIVFKIPRHSEAFSFHLLIVDRLGREVDFLSDPQVGNDPPKIP
ncbi:MAG: hypothetical protein KA144_06300 [Xanthomonadaceae bacterium]|nr:hypothetical protein [Xanthomonadaceae bacterium]